MNENIFSESFENGSKAENKVLSLFRLIKELNEKHFRNTGWLGQNDFKTKLMKKWKTFKYWWGIHERNKRASI